MPNRAVAALPAIVFVPLDDRPVSLQLPQLFAGFGGVRLITPPNVLLGSYLQPGDPRALAAWLLEHEADAKCFVLSSDMLGYGGLVASRVPGKHAATILKHFASLRQLRRDNPQADIAVFGSVMRLAPTGVPAIGNAAEFFAAGEPSIDIAAYANLAVPQQTEADREAARILRGQLGPTLKRYLQARRRDAHVDEALLNETAHGTIDSLVLGQDDAGPVGIHLQDLAALAHHAAHLHLTNQHAAIEPGTDELGMMSLAHARSRQLGWVPRIAITYSRPGAQQVHDHIEYEAIDPTITQLVTLSGGVRVRSDEHPDINLFVYVAGTSPEERDAFLSSMYVLTESRQHVTVADLSFIDGTLDEQSVLMQALVEQHLADRLDGFASWNTDANSVGTALAAAIFWQAAQRSGAADVPAHDAFLLDRYADDYAYRLLVRAQLTTILHEEDLEQSYLLPGTAVRMESDARLLLWQQLLALRDAIFPALKLSRATISLPWQRTFEVKLQVELQPDCKAVEIQVDEVGSCRPGRALTSF